MRRATFLLAPKDFDDRIVYKSREKLDVLSLKSPFLATASPIFLCTFPFGPFLKKTTTIQYFVFFPLRILLNPSTSSSFGFSTFVTISAVHFHHLSTHSTCVSCLHVIGDFCHLTFRFTAPVTRCLEKRVNSDYLGIRRNSTW